jgi:hypothetical protein
MPCTSVGDFCASADLAIDWCVCHPRQRREKPGGLYVLLLIVMRSS